MGWLDRLLHGKRNKREAVMPARYGRVPLIRPIPPRPKGWVVAKEREDV